MTYLAITLYLLGIFPSAASARWDVAPGLREGIVIICWPLVVVVSIITGLITSLMRASTAP
jgi:hypothetical protein